MAVSLSGNSLVSDANLGAPSVSSAVVRIHLVIPCYNEARRFPRLDYADALQQQPGMSLLFVDDGSRDDTASILRDFCAAHPERCELLVLPVNVGKAEAVRRGMSHATDGAPSVEYLGYFDADLAIPLQEAFSFFRMLGDRRPALIMGARVRLLGTTRIARSLARHLMSRAFATLVSAATGLPIYDTQAGAKLVRVDVARALFQRPFINRWTFDVELLYRCMERFGRKHLDEHVAEVPLRRLRDRGGSTITVRQAVIVPIALLRTWWAYRPAKRELQ